MVYFIDVSNHQLTVVPWNGILFDSLSTPILITSLLDNYPNPQYNRFKQTIHPYIIEDQEGN